MKKWKSPLVLALTAGLILLCACLPQLAAALADGRPESGYAPLKAVEFTLRGGGDMLSKIAIQYHANQSIEIAEELATHTIDEMLDFAAEALLPYQEAGIILTPDLDVHRQLISYTPFMVAADGAEGTRSNVLWTLRILFDEEEPILWMTMDDETGKIIFMSYEYSKEAWFDKYSSLEKLVELYFSGLGEDVPTIDAPNLSNKHQDGEIVGQHWVHYWVDEDLGDCGIIFYLYRYGFYISHTEKWED